MGWIRAIGRRGGAVLSALLMVLAPALAGAEPLLRVTDAAGQTHDFDRAELEGLPQVEFVTTTLWTDGPTRFSGPPLRQVLSLAGIDSGRVNLIALNEYSAELDVGGLTDAAPIIAMRRDGQLFGVRDNGPLWLIYPFDSDVAYQAEEVYAASVWQLVEVRALDP